MAWDKKLLATCKAFMQDQSKLELYRDYRDYLDPNQVRYFIWYVEDQIEAWRLDLSPEDYLYEWLMNDQETDWFRQYELEQYQEAFYNPFMEQHPEYQWQEDEVDEILWDIMYGLDMYDANVKHFDKGYNFYLLTNPENTLTVIDYPYKRFPEKYFKQLKVSQWWTEWSKAMCTLYDWAYWTLWICVHLNISLFEMVNIMKSKTLTVRKWSSIYLFNPFDWSGWCDTELILDWKFKFDLAEICVWIDWAKYGPRWYTPQEVYDWYHSVFDKNKVLSTYK